MMRLLVLVALFVVSRCNWLPGFSYASDNGCVLFKNGTMACFGLGFYGLNGQGNRESVNIYQMRVMEWPGFGLTPIAAVLAKAQTACGITPTGKAYCAGVNNFQEKVTTTEEANWIGTSPTMMPSSATTLNMRRPEEPIYEVGVGGGGLGYVLDDTSRFIMRGAGNNVYGTLYRGDSFPRVFGAAAPMRPWDEDIATSPLQDVGYLVPLDPTLGHIHFEMGLGRSCVVFTNYLMKCFGFVMNYDLAGSSIGDGPLERGVYNPFVKYTTAKPWTHRRTIVGDEFQCAEHTTDALVCSGYGLSGQLGNTNEITLGFAPHYGMHGPTSPQTAAPYLLFSDASGVKSSCSGSAFSCVVFGSKKVRCWGTNIESQLGISAFNSTAVGIFMSDIPNLPFVNIPPAMEVYCGTVSACAMLDDTSGKKFTCWGAGLNYRLGTTSTETWDIPTKGSPSPYWPITGNDLKLYRVHPRLLTKSPGARPTLRINAPWSYVAAAATLRFTDLATATVFNVALTPALKPSSHLIYIPDISIPDVGALGANFVECKLELLDSGNALIAGPAEGLDSVTFSNGVMALDLVFPPSNPTVASFAITIQGDTWLDDIGFRAPGTCHISTSAIAYTEPFYWGQLEYIGADKFVCEGFTPGTKTTAAVPGLYNIFVSFGKGFSPIKVTQTIRLFTLNLDSVEPNVAVHGSTVLKLSGPMDDTAQPALCRFRDGAKTAVATTRTSAAVYDTDPDPNLSYINCPVPLFPEIFAAAVSFPYQLQVAASLNNGRDWTNELVVSILAPFKPSFATPASFPAAAGTITISGSGFVPVISALVRSCPADLSLVPPNCPTFAATYVSVTKTFSVVSISVGSGLQLMDIALDGQTFSGTSISSSAYLVSGVAPSNGPLAGGTSVSVIGAGFLATASQLRCKFGTSTVSAIYSSSTRVVCVSPAGPGTVPVSVSVSVTCNAIDYTPVIPAASFVFFTPTFTGAVPRLLPGSVPVSSVAPYRVSLTTPLAVPVAQQTRCQLGSWVANAVSVVVGPAGASVDCPARPGSADEEVLLSFNGQQWLPSGLLISFFDLTHTDPAGAPNSVATTVTLLGINFPTEAGATRCKFGALPQVTGTVVTGSVVKCTTPVSGSVASMPIEVSFDSGSIYSATGIQFKMYTEPVVLSVNPSSGQAGTLVTVTGTDFVDQGLPYHCEFGTSSGRVRSQLAIVGTTQIICAAPPLSGVVAVRVSLNDAVTFSGTSATFTYVSVAVLSPNLGPVGSSTTVVVEGSGFINGASCRFGGTVVVPAVWRSSAAIECASPTSFPVGAQTLEVSNTGVAYTTDGHLFTYYGAVTVTGVQPALIPSTGTTPITVKGTGFFNPVLGGLSCRFALETVVPATYLAVDRISCSPPKNLGVLAVEISFNNVNFHLSTQSVELFSVASAEPLLGPVSGGADVVFSGSGFGAGPAFYCRFGTIVTLGTLSTPSQGSCPTPLVPGPGPLAVDFSADNVIFSTTSFTYTFYASPKVTASLPVAGPSQGGYSVTLFGLNFADRGSPIWCRFGLKSVLASAFIVPTSAVLCTAPASSGVVTLQVSLNNANHFSPGGPAFNIYSVFLLSPNTGPTSGLTPVVIFGSDIPNAPGALCRFGALNTVKATFVSSGQVKCSSPAVASIGPLFVEYSHDGGVFTSASREFSYFQAPVLISLSPANAPLVPGLEINVLGSNFFAPAIASDLVCRFGTVISSKVTFVHVGLIQCALPPGSDVVQVTLSFNGGVQYTSTSLAFSYVSLKSIFPTLGPLVGGTVLVLVGSGFSKVNGPRCKFDTTIVTAQVLSSTSVQCASPPGAAVGTVQVSYSGDNVLYTSSFTYTYYSTPAVTAVFPQEGPSSGGFDVTVFGTNFADTGATIYCRIDLESVTPVPPTVQTFGPLSGVVCPFPRGSDAARVEVSFNEGVSFSSGNTYFGYFSVFALVPNIGPASGGTSISVSGVGFVDTALSRCKIGNVTVATEYISSGLVKCLTPVLPAGLFTIEYTSDDVHYTGDLKNFLVYSDPVITSVSPRGG